ncbi:hypothetical protein ACA910_019670 [Epithemia clementina (nom. ined.)]
MDCVLGSEEPQIQRCKDDRNRLQLVRRKQQQRSPLRVLFAIVIGASIVLAAPVLFQEHVSSVQENTMNDQLSPPSPSSYLKASLPNQQNLAVEENEDEEPVLTEIIAEDESIDSGRVDEPEIASLQRGYVTDQTSGEGIEYLWQMPIPERNSNAAKSTTTAIPVKAILFVAHGCKHSATDWWSSSSSSSSTVTSSFTSCPECIGLPEERAIVQLARERGMLVVAVSSRDRVQKCWKKSDGPRIVQVLTHILGQLHLDHVNNSKDGTTPTELIVPIFGLGSSSGAEMVGSILPRALYEAAATTSNKSGMDFRLNGVILQNKLPNDRHDRFIPAAYITLPMSGLDDKITDYITQERQKRPSKQINLLPYKIGPSFFHGRIPDIIPISVSEKIYQQLRQVNLVDEHGILWQNPKDTISLWTPRLAPLVAGTNDNLIPDESAIYEVLNVAYGHHQTTRDGVAEALDWLLRMNAEQRVSSF